MTVTRNIEIKVINSLKNQQITCGECVGFSKEILKDKKLCNGCGILPSSIPCKSFKPNTNELIPLIEEGDTFYALASFMRRIPTEKLRLIGATFMREHKTRSSGFYMGQKVYVRYRGQARSNYMSNFMSAFVLYADPEMIRIGSRTGKQHMTFTGSAQDAIFSNTDFKKMRENMIKSGRYVDPDVQHLISKRLRCEEEYELGIIESANPGDIPTIDRVFKENKVKKGKAGPNDLVAIVNAIESGYEVKAKRGKNSKRELNVGSEYSVDVNG